MSTFVHTERILVWTWWANTLMVGYIGVLFDSVHLCPLYSLRASISWVPCARLSATTVWDGIHNFATHLVPWLASDLQEQGERILTCESSYMRCLWKSIYLVLDTKEVNHNNKAPLWFFKKFLFLPASLAIWSTIEMVKWISEYSKFGCKMLQLHEWNGYMSVRHSVLRTESTPRHRLHLLVILDSCF